MADTIKTKVAIEGEKEYRQQLKDMATGLKTLGSEMKVVTSEFAGQEKSTEALSAKNAVLEKQTYLLNKQLAEQEEYLKKVTQAYGEANPKTQAAQQAVNNTKAALNKANAEIKANNEQISKNSSALGKLGIDLDGIAEKLGISSSSLSKLTGAFGTGAVAAGAFSAAVTKLAAELVKISDAATKYGDNVSTLATKYNMTAQSIQKFQYISQLADVSVETITGSITKLTRNMDSARSGTGSAAEAFNKLGISIKTSDGSLRNANQVFAEAIDALGRVGNETERDALAMSMFGKSAMELNPLIKEGAAGLKELSDEAENSGYVMSDKMIAVLHEGDDATQRFDKSIEGLKNTIGAGATPIVAGWKMAIADAADALSVAIQKIAGLRDESVSLSGVTSDLTGITDMQTQSLRAYTDEVEKAKLAEMSLAQQRSYIINKMQSEGLSSEIQKYDPNTGVAYSTLVSKSDAAALRAGELSFDQLYNETVQQQIARMQSQPIQLQVNLDSQTIARATYDANRAESNRIGNHAIR